jgi:hypothetical protein
MAKSLRLREANERKYQTRLKRLEIDKHFRSEGYIAKSFIKLTPSGRVK